MLKFTSIVCFSLLLTPLFSCGQYIPLDNRYYSILQQKYQEYDKLTLLPSLKSKLIKDIDSIKDIEYALSLVPVN